MVIPRVADVIQSKSFFTELSNLDETSQGIRNNSSVRRLVTIVCLRNV